jgi:transposase
MYKGCAIVVHPQTRRKLQRKALRCKDAAMRTRLLIICHSADGRSRPWIAQALGCCKTTVSRVRHRWRTAGEAGLVDRREDNGPTKVDEDLVATVQQILIGRPKDFGHRRSTWTLALLVQTAYQRTGVRVSRTTMGRILAVLKARWGRAKPIALCPWSKRRKQKRLAMLASLIESLPPEEACFWQDEVDIHLNPRIGYDWMLPKTQRQVDTPGTNIKRYLAGALDARSGRLIWVPGERKNSQLFLDLLARLVQVYSDKKRLHLIVDNFKIHDSAQTRAWLVKQKGRIVLHFLPPYCPDDNRIERSVWRELHANVTINHTCKTMDDLMHEVTRYLRKRSLQLQKRTVAELREAI